MPLRIRYRRRPRFREPEFPKRTGVETLLAAAGTIAGAAWLPALIFILPLLYYWPVLQAGFASDDFFYHAAFTQTFRDYIKELALIHAGELEFPFFRPAAIISFRLDYFLWGADPVGFHLTNLILHALNAVLLFHLARLLGLGRLGAAAAALFFGLYPAHPEAVTWVSGRFDVLSLTWLLISLLLWCNGRLRGDWRLLGGSAAAFLVAVLAKEVAAAGFLLLPLIDWLLHLRARREWGQGTPWRWKWYVVFFAVVVLVVAFRYWLYGDLGGYSDQHLQSKYFATDLSTFYRNLVASDLLILFTPLSRPLWADWSWGWRILLIVVAIASACGLIASIVRAILLLRRSDETILVWIVTSILWIVIMLLPVSTIGPVYDTLDFSRFLYLPAVGLALWIGVAVGLGVLGGEQWRRATLVLLVLLLLASGFALRGHNKAWLEAGEIAGRIHATMDTHTAGLPDGATVFVVNYPWLWKGAHCAPLKYEGYIEFRYGAKNVEIQIIRKDAEEVQEWWERIRRGWPRPGVGFEWDRSENTLRVLPPILPIAPETGTAPSILGPEVPPLFSEEIPEVDVLPEPIR